MAQLKANSKKTDQKQSALVLLSGGQDSLTCLAWALQKFKSVKTVSFDYGQRHKIELKYATKIAKKLNLEHKILPINTFGKLGQNALTHKKIAVENTKKGSPKALPNTFVPGRNLIFLTFAAAHAYTFNIHNLVTGVCQTDYSGYPDCRENTIKNLEKTIQLGMDYEIQIHTPLMHLNKAQTVELIKELGYFDLLQYSHTCYNGQRPACGKCPACTLRLKGFAEAGEVDPLQYAK